MNPTQLQGALRADPGVFDCAVIAREGPDGNAHTIAYVVPNGPLSTPRMLRQLAERFGPEGVPDAVLQVPAIPLTGEGDRDTAALLALPVPDALLLARAEAIAASAVGARRVAAVASWSTVAPAPLHLSDFVPGWTRFAAAAPAPATERIVPAATPADGPLAIASGGELRLPDDAPRWLGDLVARAAHAQPPAGMVFHESGGVETFVSYAQLYANAQRILGGLRGAGVEPGMHVVFHFRSNRDFFEAFWACILGRMVPVPTPVAASYSDVNGNVRRLGDACGMFGDAYVATSAELADDVRGALRLLEVDAHILTVESLRSAASAAPAASAAAGDVALMMLTSGSTGRPKGVPLTHRNLLARSLASCRRNRLDSGSVSLNWMPLDHVAGLILVHLRDMCVACRQVHVATELVLRDPLLWIDMMDRHRATATFAPNFAFGLVCARADDIARRSWDLSCVRRIVNGGEAIVAASARKFLRLLAPHGLAGDTMVPAWGMSETSSGVTYSENFRLDTIADGDAYVPVGPPLEGVKLRIVDEGDRPLREGQVGHLQVAGETLFPGYFADRPPRAEVFTADGWFRTGDLARLDGGVLSITGRAKDVIIVNGANFSGPAIENAVDNLPGVAPSFTAACGVPDPRAGGGEGLAIFFAPEDESDDALGGTLRAIRQRLVHDFGIGPAFIVPLRRDDIPKTSIGKIQRTALQKALVSGQYEAALKRVDLLMGNANTVPAWFFRRAWRPKAIAPQGGEDASEGDVIVLGGADALTGALAEALAARHRRMVRIDLAPDAITPSMQALDSRGLDARHVVYLWNAQADGGLPDEESARAARACARLAAGVSALQALRGPFTLTVVSNGVANVGGNDHADIARGTVAALVHSIGRESERVRARHLDCGDMSPAQAAKTIVEEMRADSPDGEVAYRDGKRFVPVLVPLATSAPAAAQGPLRRGGRYLVSGGLGGVGSALVAFLLREYDAQVLVVGRGEPSAAFERLREISPRVRYARANVGDAAALRAATQPVLSTWDGPLTAAFHLATDFHEASLRDETESTLREAFFAKIAGANALLGLLREHPGAALVGFSSMVSIFGGAMVGAYAAANRYLDALAARGGATPVYSVDWSAWRDTGLNRRFGALEALRAMGGVELPPEAALASLQVALSQPPGQLAVGLDRANAHVARHVGVVPLSCTINVFCEGGEDAAAARAFAPLRDRFGTPCPIAATPVPALPATADGEVDLAALERMAGHGVRLHAATNATEQALWEIWRRVLGLDAIGVDESFFEIGGQSLLATQLLSAIAARFGARWSLRDIFTAPTIAAQAARIDAAGVQSAGAPAAPRAAASRERSMPLAPGQQRLWFLDRVHPHNPAYHISATVRFDACPDPGLLRGCLQALADRHESLRTRFPDMGAEPRQWIESEAPVAFTVDEIESAPAFDALLEAEARRPFDLQSGPLWRARLARLPGGRGTLILTLHHSIADGWSMKVLFRELLALLGSRGTARLAPLALQYADFAAALDEGVRTGRFQGQVDYWKAQLGSNLHGFSVPTDRPRPPVQTYSGARLTVPLPAALARRTRALARQRGVTPFVALLAAYKAMLARYTQQSDIIVGTVFSNRNRTEIEPIVGFVVNMLAMRTDLGGDPRFADILQRVQRVVLDGHAHAEVPFESLVDLLQPPRDASRPPLFQVAFDMRDPEITRSTLEGVTLGVMEPDLGASQYDLHLTFAEAGEGLTAIWHYNTDLFLPATIERMAANYLTLLEAAVDEPEQRLSRLRLLAPAERRRLLVEWNRTATGYPRDSSIKDLFEAQARATPRAIAIEYGGQSLTYAELDRRANQVAHHLGSLGVGRDTPVAVLMERSLELVAGILGILKAGGAYLPLDLGNPRARLEFIVADAAAPVLLTQRSLRDRLPAYGGHVVCIDTDAQAIAARPDASPGVAVKATDLAYIIYTSGSTGLPKGTCIEQRSVVRLVKDTDFIELGPEEVFLQFAPVAFDASTLELWAPLLNGGRLVVCPAGPQSLAALARVIRESRVSVLWLTAALFNQMVNEQLECLRGVRQLFAGGETLSVAHARRMLEAMPPTSRLVNGYGPTENTTFTACHAMPGGSSCEGPVPIGRPIANTRVYILDAHMQPVPIGMSGELYIGGDGLARGYLNRPDLDAERFVRDPFSAEPGARLYRSGDLARYRDDGVIEFLGRMDLQVKIRGFRVEPAEIEAVLCGHPDVREAAVVVREDAQGDKALVAYVVAREGRSPTVGELREHLRGALPEPMVPAMVVLLDAMPITANGKVDRAALPDPGRAAAAARQVDLPQNEIERLVAGVWQQVLDVPSVDRRQNFFEAGGHSLKMTRVHALLSERLGRDLPVVDLFRYPTVASLAAHLSRTAPKASPTEIEGSTIT